MTTITEIKQFIVKSNWESITPEIRPSIVKTEAGNIKPLYCNREFYFPAADQFELTFNNFADSNGWMPLVRMEIKGHLNFGNPHPVAPGAFELEYIADISFRITLLHEAFVIALNQGMPAESAERWKLNVNQDVMGRSLPAFGLTEGEYFREFDLIYIYNDMLFNGARHVDGQPFDIPENRPTNLQVPLKRQGK